MGRISFKGFRHFGFGVHKRNVKRATCETGSFYIAPTAGQQVNVSEPVALSWDPSCLNSTDVDIYLYAPDAPTPLVHAWSTVPRSDGKYSATLKPSWWQGAQNAKLQFLIIEHGKPVWTHSLPAGPYFTAISSGTTDGTAQPATTASTPGDTVTVVGGLSSSHTLSGGKVAAAVLVPLIALFAVVYFFIRRSRASAAAEKSAFTQQVDKRMSTISTDWKSMSAAGANAAVRNSIAQHRNSSFSFGAIRPDSEYGTNHAGAGALYSQDNGDIEYQVAPRRPRPTNASGSPRSSRVSFATNDPRPSASDRESQYRRSTTRSRAFHDGFVPPMPGRNYSSDNLHADADAYALSSGEIEQRASMADYLPALNMMRSEHEDRDYMLPESPSKAHAKTSSPPLSSNGSVEAVPASVMSPDEMLRAYAARKNQAAPSGGITYPAPVANTNYNGAGMRNLYSPTTPGSPEDTLEQPQSPGKVEHYSYSKGYSVGGRYVNNSGPM